MRFAGDRVRIVGVSEFAGREATVVQDNGWGWLYVLIDEAGFNPVPFARGELEDV
jgi:hypothetical protein